MPLTPGASRRLRIAGLADLIASINAGEGIPAPKVLPHRVNASGTAFLAGLLTAARAEYWTEQINLEGERLAEGHYFIIEGFARIPATKAMWQAEGPEGEGSGDSARRIARRIYMRGYMRERRERGREGST